MLHTWVHQYPLSPPYLKIHAASCKANEVEPLAYLRDVLTRMPTQPPDQLDELLPDRWLKAHPQHRWHIDAIRRQERRRSQSRTKAAPAT